MGQSESTATPAPPTSKFDLSEQNLDMMERKVLNQSNYRWVQCTDQGDQNYGKKLFSYYDG